MNLSKVFLTKMSYDVNKLKKPLMKNSNMMKKSIFAFSTSNNVVSNANKIIKILPNVQSIKVWSL